MASGNDSKLEQGEIRNNSSVKCNSCLNERKNVRSADFACFTCELSLCSSCSRNHASHRCVRRNGEGYRREIERTWEDVNNEFFRKINFKEEKAELYDRIDVKAELDLKRCHVTGMCILEHSSLVVCDEENSCIKLFDLRNYSLQRYISLSSTPYGVTEVKGVGDRVIAVTLPAIHKIVFLDLYSTPAKKTKVIETDNPCFTIGSSTDNLCAVYITLSEDYFDKNLNDLNWAVYIMSSNGDIIRSHKSDIRCNSIFYNRLSDGPHRYRYFDPPYIAVLPNRIYLTERWRAQIFCINLDGETFFTMYKACTLSGICADKTSEHLHICTTDQDIAKNILYELSSDLIKKKKMVEFKLDYQWGTRPLCYYKDRLFVAHPHNRHSLHNHVTVVRLL